MRNSLPGDHVHNQQEMLMITIASLQAVFLGAFIALFNIGSHVLFLQSWDPAMIPQAYIISGFLGILVFSLYSLFVNRTSIRFFTASWFLLLFLANVALYVFYDAIAHFKLLGIPLMLPFTVCIPFTLLAMLLFRRSANMTYYPGQHRRLYPILHTAFIAGIIGTSYALVGALFINWDILLITAGSALAMGMALILQFIINLLHRKSGFFPQPVKRIAPLRSKFYEIIYTRYTFLLVIFVLFSAIIGFIVHFHFISETRFNYPHTIGLAKFLGFFTGTMFLFVFAVERFLVKKILYAYDSPYSLVLIPAILAIASVASLVIDLLFGQDNAFARFSFGFLMIAMLKIGYETTYQAIELPSLRVMYRTLDLRFIASIKTRLEGSFRMISLILAGLLLSGMLFLNLGKSLFLNLLILGFALLWIPVGIWMVKSYQNSLREFIRRLKASKRSIGQDLLNTDEKSHSLINSKNPVKTINTLSIMERIEPLTHEKHLVSLLRNDAVELRNYLLERIDSNALLNSLPLLKELQKLDQPKQLNGYLTKLINRFEIKLQAGATKHAIEQLVNSATLTDRILAAEIIGNSGNMELEGFLISLSRDFEPEVKLASVKAMARLGSPIHSYLLIGFLNTPVYYPYAFEALCKIGDPALPFMEEMFLLPEADNVLLSRIVRIYGKIGSPAAIEYLLSKIENQNRMIARQALLSLREAKFQATPGNINRILNDIVRLINVMSWNFAAYSSIQEKKKFRLLINALYTEIAENYNTLYHLLALAYNPTSISNIKMMLMDGNDTDISFAIELLDQIVNEEIKQVFFPVVENIPVKERFKQLQYFFQATKENPENLIQDIITRDFNQLSLYAKACAIYSILSINRNHAGQEVIASIFHPNQLISESAAFVLEKLESEKLESVFARLSPERVTELKTALSNVNGEIPYLLLDRIRFVKSCKALGNISEDVLLEISRTLNVHTMKAGEEFLVKREDVHFAFIIIIDGKAQINNSSGKVFTFGKYDIIYSDLFVENNTYSLQALSDLRIFSLEQEALNALMFDYIDFRNTILEIVEEA